MAIGHWEFVIGHWAFPSAQFTIPKVTFIESANHYFSRLNITLKDVTDLFGADLPVEGGEAGQFVWRDGPLLKALRAGHWIVLDEVLSWR